MKQPKHNDKRILNQRAITPTQIQETNQIRATHKQTKTRKRNKQNQHRNHQTQTSEIKQ